MLQQQRCGTLIRLFSGNLFFWENINFDYISALKRILIHTGTRIFKFVALFQASIVLHKTGAMRPTGACLIPQKHAQSPKIQSATWLSTTFICFNATTFWTHWKFVVDLKWINLVEKVGSFLALSFCFRN